MKFLTIFVILSFGVSACPFLLLPPSRALSLTFSSDFECFLPAFLGSYHANGLTLTRTPPCLAIRQGSLSMSEGWFSAELYLWDLEKLKMWQ
jgi:hypothetical protein